MLHHITILILTFTLAFGMGIGNDHVNRYFTKAERSLWHFVYGGAWAVVAVYLAYLQGSFFMITYLLIRLGLFNLSYNWGGKLNPRYQGDGVEKIENWQIKIFGKRGAVLQAVICLPLALLLNIAYANNFLNIKNFFTAIDGKIH